VASVLGRDLPVVDAAIDAVADQLGRLGFVSEVLAFRWTRYYHDEIGETPARRFVALEELCDPSRLAQLKRATSRLEVALARPGRPRSVNIDPGVLNGQQLVLASTKARGSRIYLGQGIFAELALLWQEEGYAPLPWTYPDYRDAEVRGLFERLRTLYLARRRLEPRS